MISKISIRNYKCLRDVQVDLDRFTFFVGPNASGKSSILQALYFLCEIFGLNRSQKYEAVLFQGLSRGATEPLELLGETGGKAFRYRTLSPSPRSVTPPKRTKNWEGEGWGIATNLATLDWKQWTPPPTGLNPLPRAVLLHLEPSKLVLPTPTSDRATMSSDGTGLHSALANMALNDPDSWQTLQADLRRIIPTIRRLRHTRTANVQQPPALLFDTLGAESVQANQVSEGTLLVLGLLTAFQGPDRPSLILLDDLDRGLHPKAQKELIVLLRELLKTNADLQIVATTHSSYMLDCMGVNEVRMTFLNDDGATICAPLSSHPKYPKWKDEMTPGEMWSMFGEKWVAEKEKAP